MSKEILRNWCGNGPWKVFMLINNSAKNNKVTDLRIHTYPEAVETLMNDVLPAGKTNWTIILTIGDFYSLDKALEYHSLWLEKTRGTKSRLFTGIKLYNHFKEVEKLWALTIPTTKEKLLRMSEEKRNSCDEEVQRKKRWEAAKDFVNGRDVPDIANIVCLKDIYSNRYSFFM